MLISSCYGILVCSKMFLYNDDEKVDENCHLRPYRYPTFYFSKFSRVSPYIIPCNCNSIQLENDWMKIKSKLVVETMMKIARNKRSLKKKKIVKYNYVKFLNLTSIAIIIFWSCSGWEVKMNWLFGELKIDSVKIFVGISDSLYDGRSLTEEILTSVSSVIRIILQKEENVHFRLRILR